MTGGAGAGRARLAARALAVALVALVAAGGVRSADAAPPRDRREMQAREAFAAGNYKEALDIYVKLYAEKLHPTYLRNIGRCYQNLGDADKAMGSFREYLRKARDIGAAERAEIDGYIGELEAQQAEQRRREAPQIAAPAPVPAPAVAAPAASALARAPEPAPALAVAQAPSVPEPIEPRPVWRRWWFWTAVGGAVVLGAVGLAASGVFSGAKDAPCPAGRTCVP